MRIIFSTNVVNTFFRPNYCLENTLRLYLCLNMKISIVLSADSSLKFSAPTYLKIRRTLKRLSAEMIYVTLDIFCASFILSVTNFCIEKRKLCGEKILDFTSKWFIFVCVKLLRKYKI